MKNISDILRTGVLAAAGLLACYSCSDTWDDHYDVNESSASVGRTLYEQIAQDPDLSNFKQVLDAVKLIRSKKYAVDADNNPLTYKDVFDGSQRYTIWAPVNGSGSGYTLDEQTRDSLIEAAQASFRGDSLVAAQFIKNLYTRYNWSVSSLSDSAITMMNSKVLRSAANTFDDVAYVEKNIQCKNGILHKMVAPIPFKYNIYEYICTNEKLEGLASFLNGFQTDSLDANSSTQESIDPETGLPIYSDSVMISQNIMRDAMGYISREDSNYVSLVPTTEAWNAAYEKLKTYFNYPTYNENRDSLQRLYAGQAAVKDLTFNMNSQYNGAPYDSLCSISAHPRTTYTRNQAHEHIYTNPMSAGGPFEGYSYSAANGFSGANVVDCSNGQLIMVDKWPYRTIDMLWSPDVFSVAGGESNFLITEGKESAATLSYETALYSGFENPDEMDYYVPYNTYADVVPSNNNSRPDVTFKLHDIFSTTYDIGLIVVSPNIDRATAIETPDSIKELLNWDKKVATFTFQLTYYTADGTKKTTTAVRNLTTNPDVLVDTIWVQKGFEVPVCSYGISNDASHTVTAEVVITSRYRETTGKPLEGTTNEIRLAGLYVKPTEYDNE